MSIWGQRVPTDQVAQAARLALALRRLVPRAPMALVTGRSQLVGSWPVGETVDRASKLVHARMPAATRAGAIRIDDVTAGFLDARFVVEGDDQGLLLRGERAGGEARTLLGKPTPFVGRERELRLLEEIFAECVEEPVARVVLVTAAPGVGKSRLRQELLGKLRAGHEAFQLWTGRGDPMRSGAPFSLLGEALQRAVGISGDEEPEAQREKLSARVAQRVPADQVGRVSEFLGELAGVPFSGVASAQLQAARRDPMLMGAQTQRAWREWLAAECSHQPVVIVLEDLHWGDLPTVKYIDMALQALREQPLFVLGLARPEVHDLFPHMWAERGLQQLHLARSRGAPPSGWCATSCPRRATAACAASSSAPRATRSSSRSSVARWSRARTPPCPRRWWRWCRGVSRPWSRAHGASCARRASSARSSGSAAFARCWAARSRAPTSSSGCPSWWRARWSSGGKGRGSRGRPSTRSVTRWCATRPTRC
jgi:hypothetical protein